jgi:hypothetical protein
MALLFRDPSPSLSSQPAYALPLNSVDASHNSTFDPKTGYNLIATLKVGSSHCRSDRAAYHWPVTAAEPAHRDEVP